MKFIPKAMTRTLARQVLVAKKNSPHIFFVAGVAGVVGSTVLACRSTLKLEKTLIDVKHDIDEVKHLRDKPQLFTAEEQYEAQYYRDLTYVYAKGTYRLARLYGPSVIVGAASIAALTGSHITLTKRNTALTAAYAGIAKAYDEYRYRVREELGEEKELDIYHSVTNEKVKNEDGKAELVKFADPNTFSQYARFFDEASPNWVKNAEMNRMFVQCQQNYANHRLITRGHLFLNEVYEMLGIPHCRAGAVVGWVISNEGDNYVDFGMFEAANARFIEGWERNILLDFNVDGVIFDKIKE